MQVGLSFFLETHRGGDLVGHSGNQGGFLSHHYLRRSRAGRRLCIAFNTDASSAAKAKARITRDVDDAVRDRLLEELAGSR